MLHGGRMALVALAAFVTLTPGPDAWAHASDFETLTLDFLIGPHGLETVDAAVVAAPGPNHQPFPTEEDRRYVVAKVLEVLAIAETDAAVDTTQSERYHEVGFTVRVHRRAAEPTNATLHVDTALLQRVVAQLKLKRLKLEVCDAHAVDPVNSQPGAGDKSTHALDVDANRPGRASDYRQNEREGCQVWTLAPTDPPVSLSARIKRVALAKTGSDTRTILYVAAALAAGGLGLGLVALGKRNGTQ